jgi:hypothetical protein
VEANSDASNSGTPPLDYPPTWALANISSIEIDPAFLLIDPDAQLILSPDVNQTGFNTLPTGGQP